MTPTLSPDDLAPYYRTRQRNQLGWLVPQAAMSPSGSTFAQGGFDPEAPPEDAAWPNQTALDPAAFRVDAVSSSGPGGLGQSGQPQPDKSSPTISAAAGKVINQSKMAPPGMTARSIAPAPAQASPQPQPAPGRMPPPGTNPQIAQIEQRMADRAANPPQMIGNRPQDFDPATGKEKLGAKAASWGQRLALAVLAATKLAPYAQQIVRPEYSQQVAAQQAAEKMDEAQLKGLESGANIEALNEQRAATGEQRRALAADYQQREEERKRDNLAREQLKADQDFTQSLPKEDTITGLDANDPNIPQLQQQGYHVIDDMRDHREGVPKMKVAIPPRFVTVTPENAPILTGHKPGTLVPWSEYKSSLAEYQKAQREAQKPKPQTAEGEKLAFQGIIQKLAGENGMTPAALTDARLLMPAIQKSAALSPEEKTHAIAYLTANPTPAASGTQAVIRMEGMQQSREMPVLDTQNGNTPMFLNAADINAANKLQPGRYLPAGVGIPAINKTALLEDIRGGVQQVRQSLANMPEFSATDKAKIALAMRSSDPKSAISSLIQNAAAGSMTPEMQEYLINHATLIENAMAMRSVLGAGQGSDDLRSAIAATVPGPKTPNKAYALQQLDSFEKVLNRLERGIPKVPLRNDIGGSGATAPIVQHSQSTGQYRYSLDGGKTWQPGQPPSR